MPARHPRRADHAAPVGVNTVDALLSQRRHVRHRTAQSLRRRDADHANAARRQMRREIRDRAGYHVDLAADRGRQRLARRPVNDETHVLHLHARTAQPHYRAHVRAAANRGRHADRDRARILTQPLDHITHGLERRIGAHYERHVIVEQHRDRGDVLIADAVRAQHGIRHEAGAAHREREAVAALLDHVPPRDTLAGSRLVDHDHRRRHQLLLVQRALDEARSQIDAAAGRGSHDQCNRARRLPALRRDIE